MTYQDQYRSPIGSTEPTSLGATSAPEPPPAQLHDDSFDPVSLWQLDGNLLDARGVEDLVLDAGDEAYGPAAAQNAEAFWFDGATRLTGATNPAPAALQINGDVTIEMLYFPTDFFLGSFGSLLVACIGASGTTASNQNHQWIAAMATEVDRPSFQWERLSGSLQTFNPVAVRVINQQWNHLAYVRDGADALIYVNGELRDSATLAGAATGGSLTRIFMGQIASGDFELRGMLSSVKVVAAALTADQILGEAQRTLPFVLRPA